MLSISRALEFLGSQGVTALGNLVLSRQDSLLLDVRSTVPANEVAHFVVITSPHLVAFFPSPLLDSALNLVRVASTAALHRTLRHLHPPMIPRLGPLPLPLLTMVAPLPWCLSHSAKHRRPPPLPRPNRVGSGWGAEVWCLFWRLWLLRWQMPGYRVEVLLTGFCFCYGWGVAVSTLEALAGSWSRILGAVRPEEQLPHPFQGFSSSPRSHPISFPTSRIGSPRSLALCQVIVVILAMTALEIILGFSSRLFLMEKMAVAWCPVIDLSLPNEFVLRSPFMIETVASVLLSIREGDFLASVN